MHIWGKISLGLLFSLELITLIVAGVALRKINRHVPSTPSVSYKTLQGALTTIITTEEPVFWSAENPKAVVYQDSFTLAVSVDADTNFWILGTDGATTNSFVSYNNWGCHTMQSTDKNVTELKAVCDNQQISGDVTWATITYLVGNITNLDVFLSLKPVGGTVPVNFFRQNWYPHGVWSFNSLPNTTYTWRAVVYDYYHLVTLRTLDLGLTQFRTQF